MNFLCGLKSIRELSNYLGCGKLGQWQCMSTTVENQNQRKLDLPKVIRELRRLLEINRPLSASEIDALAELRLAVRREFLSQPLEKR